MEVYLKIYWNILKKSYKVLRSWKISLRFFWQCIYQLKANININQGVEITEVSALKWTKIFSERAVSSFPRNNFLSSVGKRKFETLRTNFMTRLHFQQKFESILTIRGFFTTSIKISIRPVFLSGKKKPQKTVKKAKW